MTRVIVTYLSSIYHVTDCSTNTSH